MATEEEYKHVLDDLLASHRMFHGYFDAEHGSEVYMYGIDIVMSVIACNAGRYSEFSKEFQKNLADSIDKVEKK